MHLMEQPCYRMLSLEAMVTFNTQAVLLGFMDTIQLQMKVSPA